MKHMQAQIDARNVVIHNTLIVLDVQLVGTNAKSATNMVISVACAIRRKKHLTRKGLWSHNHPKHTQLKIGSVFVQDSIFGQSEDLSSSDDSFCLQVQLKSMQVETMIPAPQHLITNIAYKIKPQKKTQY